MVRIQIDEDGLENLVRLVQANLLTENKAPYYAHFYNQQDLIVIFPGRVFHLKPDKDTWGQAVSYGLSLGVPKRELDFNSL